MFYEKENCKVFLKENAEHRWDADIEFLLKQSRGEVMWGEGRRYEEVDGRLWILFTIYHTTNMMNLFV